MRDAPQGDKQLEMFVPDVGDIALKDGQKIMAFPLLYVGDYRGRATPVTNVEFWSKDIHIDVSASAKTGIATIRDYDVILFFISVITDWINRGEDVSRGITIHAHSLLSFARRGDGRKQYDMLEKALDRLKNTTIKITYRNGKHENVESTSWLDYYKFERDPETGRVGFLTLHLPQWIYRNAIQQSNVLTLHRDYFLLVPQARWLYRLIRKSAGTNAEGWRFSIEELHRRSGSPRSLSKWRYDLKQLLKEGPLLDYHTHLEKDENGKETLYFMKDEQLINLMEKPPEQLHGFQRKWLSNERLRLHDMGIMIDDNNEDWDRIGLGLKEPD